MIGKYWIEQLARLPVEVDVASEFRYRDPVLLPNTLGVVISQSGETADTLAALRHMKAAGVTTAGIINVPTSSMAREVDLLLPTHAGPEIGVASTKAFTCQLAVMAALAANLARAKGQLRRTRREIVRHLQRGARGDERRARAMTTRSRRWRRTIAAARDVLYLGRGPEYPLALEGALKLKEISYIHAEGYASGEMKHGPIALIDDARAADRHRAVGPAVRQDRQQHAGGAGARRAGRADLRRRRASRRRARTRSRRSRCPRSTR